MKLYTGDIRKLRGVEDYLDITVKSGDLRLAPTWNMVKGIKNGTMTKNEYTWQYYELIEKSIEDDKEFWLELIKRDELIVACYCKAFKFCHRYLLVSVFEKLCKDNNVPFVYIGEK